MGSGQIVKYSPSQGGRRNLERTQRDLRTDVSSRKGACVLPVLKSLVRSEDGRICTPFSRWTDPSSASTPQCDTKAVGGGPEHTDQEERLYGLTVKNRQKRGFPGGAVVKSPPANAGDTGSSPGPGRSHMLRSN